MRGQIRMPKETNVSVQLRKSIVSFNTHGGSGFPNTISTIAGLEPNAIVNENGFTVSRDNVQEAESDIITWLNENRF